MDLGLYPRQEGGDVGADRVFARDPHKYITALYFSAAWVVMVKKMNDEENLIG